MKWNFAPANQLISYKVLCFNDELMIITLIIMKITMVMTLMIMMMVMMTMGASSSSSTLSE